MLFCVTVSQESYVLKGKDLVVVSAYLPAYLPVTSRFGFLVDSSLVSCKARPFQLVQLEILTLSVDTNLLS